MSFVFLNSTVSICEKMSLVTCSSCKISSLDICFKCRLDSCQLVFLVFESCLHHLTHCVICAHFELLIHVSRACSLQLKLSRVEDVFLQSQKIKITSSFSIKYLSSFTIQNLSKFRTMVRLKWFTSYISQPLSFDCINQTLLLVVMYMCFRNV